MMTTAAAPNEKHVRLAARLYDMRTTARQLLGDNYDECMVNLGRQLTEFAERDQQSVLEAAMAAVKRRCLVGVDLTYVMAAAVELLEPSA